MKLTATDVDISTLVLSSEQEQARSEGVHVSAIIRRIESSIGTAKRNDFTEDDLNRFAIIGRLWEAQLAQSLYREPRYQRLGELEVDGIIGSPDVYDTQALRVGEIKVRWASAKHPIEEVRKYWWQVMAYCYMVNTRLAWLDVLYVSGDYHPPVPVFRHWDVEFSWQDIKDNWAMLKREATEL